MVHRYYVVGDALVDMLQTVTSASYSESAGGTARGQPARLLTLQLGAVAGSARGQAAAWAPVRKQGLFGNGQALAQTVNCLLEAGQKKFDFFVTLPN